MIYTYSLPKELKKALIEKGISFSEWCRRYGFNRASAQIVVNSIPYKTFEEGTKQKKIYEALKKDFPEIFKEEE